jgi:transketolase
MALIDSKTGKIISDPTLDELVHAANMMRGYDLVALCAAGSGHAGGTLSIMDIAAALYLKVANHDPLNPSWEGRDRIIWSAGHKAPSLYLGLAFAGFHPVEDVVAQAGVGLPGPSTLDEARRCGSIKWIAGAGAQHCRGRGACGKA